jgi:hypothetical protein
MKGAKVLFDTVEIDNEFVKTAAFWSAVHDNIDLFKVNPLLKITKASINTNVKVGGLDTNLPLSTVCDNLDSQTTTFKAKWGSIFEK